MPANKVVFLVSIHASVKDATPSNAFKFKPISVSIHASVKDATKSNCSVLFHFNCFNPRICKRCDFSEDNSSSADFRFNPRICKRCDYRFLPVFRLHGCFNPRICKRCDSMFVKSFIDDTFKL